MKIKEIQLTKFRSYQNWSFIPKEHGLHIIYGPNESGKSTFLEALRGLLFGWMTKDRKDSEASLRFWHDGVEYALKRKGKHLQYHPLHGDIEKTELSEAWWHGLDKKTYEKIFAITIEDMQGTGILQDVNVRTRFMGSSDTSKLSDVMKEVESASTELLVASVNGKRRINVLIEELEQLEIEIRKLQERESEYVSLKQQLDGTECTEEEMRTTLKQWQEYHQSIDLVLRAWDTYYRMEEAGAQKVKYAHGNVPDQEVFMELDQKIKEAQEHMRIWRGKEEGLLPENFTPHSPLGLYAAEIEAFYEKLSRWEQLKKNVAEGKDFIASLKERVALLHKMAATWRTDMDIPEEVNFAEGEQIVVSYRAAEEALAHWKDRQDASREDVLLWEQEGKEYKTKVEDVQRFGAGLLELKKAFQELKSVEAKKKMPSSFMPKACIGVGVLLGLLEVGMYWMRSQGHLLVDSLLLWGIGFAAILLLVFGNVTSYRQGKRQANAQDTALQEAQEKLKNIAKAYGWETPTEEADVHALEEAQALMQTALHHQSEKEVEQFSKKKQYEDWRMEGQELEAKRAHVLEAWESWLPKAATQGLPITSFFYLKQEYEIYEKERASWISYMHKVEQLERELQDIEEEAALLWKKLGEEEEPTTIRLRTLYRDLTAYKQNEVRWEQKEAQRRSYREEYDIWHAKEKEYLLAQHEILQKNHMESAAEFRKLMLSKEQYRQWDTIYKQSRKQLMLMAPNQDTQDLLLRRLKEGNRQKWVDEVDMALEHMASAESQLQKLYEKRGELIEMMRTLGMDTSLARHLQRREQLQGALSDALEDWATQVFMAHSMELAQQRYEKDQQPRVLERASRYVNMLTCGRYTLHDEGENGSLVARDVQGMDTIADVWSSGLSDQVYLALRLSLAESFSYQVEPMPIILDDILLRFDEERQKAALQVLADIAETEQIFLLTCQEQVVRLSQELARDDINVYQYQENGAVAPIRA